MREASPLDELGDAALAYEAITFAYESNGERADRHAEPYRVVVHKLRWYVLGWDLDRNDWRTYRIDRMEHLRRGDSFRPRQIPGGAAPTHQDDATPALRSTLTFDAPLGTVADRLATQEAEFASIDGAHCRAWLWADSYEWLTAVVLSMGIEFRIEESEDFREHCVEMRDRLGRAVRNGET